MAKLTRGGIAYDLKLSPYNYEVNYNENLKVVYHFSSPLYIKKFESRMDKNREKLRDSLSKRFNIGVIIPELFDILLYSKIEIRGFYITINGEEHTCLNTIKLIGVNQIQKNLQEL